MSSKNATEPPAAASISPPARRWSLAARLTAWYAVSAFFADPVGIVVVVHRAGAKLDVENDRVLLDRAIEVRQFLASCPSPDAQEIPIDSGIHAAAISHAGLPAHARCATASVRRIARNSAHCRRWMFPPPLSLVDEKTPTAVDDRRRTVTDITVLSLLAPRPARSWATASRTSSRSRWPGTAGDICWPRIARRLWIAMSAALIVCIFIGYEIARRGIRPIAQSPTSHGESARPRSMRASTPPNMPAELQSLAGEFNEMLDRLQESFARISRFSADIAHELRTPVNNLRGAAEVALTKARSREEYHEALASTSKSVCGSSHIIENLLFLARARIQSTRSCASRWTSATSWRRSRSSTKPRRRKPVCRSM